MKRIAVLPFSGFYWTVHEEQIKNAIEWIFSDGNGSPRCSIINRIYDCLNFRSVYKNYAKEYTEQFAHKFGVKLSFLYVESPREYNFHNDKIIVEIEESELSRIFIEVNKVSLAEKIADELRPRDGFIPYFSNNIDDWGPVEIWSPAQLEILLRQYGDDKSDGELDEFELIEPAICNGLVEDWFFSAGGEELTRLDRINNYLNKRAGR